LFASCQVVFGDRRSGSHFLEVVGMAKDLGKLGRTKQYEELPSCESSTQWWGVKDDKGQWAFGGGMVCHYPCEAVAMAHAESLSTRWKAVSFE
jgi:hypothetical protein